MYNTQPEIIGIYNNGVATSGSSGSSGGSGLDITITVPNAGLSTTGIVRTCNDSSGQVTSETVNVVPTQYYVQQEIARLDARIDSAMHFTPISSSIIN